ncbi:cyanophycinase [Flaviaesturariibacter amylovorans]|uniref:Cyanophycinase n=1 Tax=Flaviaesturariibacter amylovorans TaxID=1084520 RepID=A0ABP8H1M2_9BACT
MQYPKGYLVSIGGAEDKGGTLEEQERRDLDFFRYGILENVRSLMQRKEPHIEVITTASSIPNEYFNEYEKAFRSLGFCEVGHALIRERPDAEDEEILERLRRCDGVLMTGGDQLRLCSTLGGTPFFDVLRERYLEEPFVIAGTSAGAAAMSSTMICGGDPVRAYFKGEVQLSMGFGFLNNVIIDTHFDKRGRFGRLAQAIAAQPGAIGIGLGEDTGIVVEEGYRFRAIGSSSVVVIDGHNVHHNNIHAVRTGAPVSVANLTVHIMTHADEYDSRHRVFSGNKFDLHED